MLAKSGSFEDLTQSVSDGLRSHVGDKLRARVQLPCLTVEKAGHVRLVVSFAFPSLPHALGGCPCPRQAGFQGDSHHPRPHRQSASQPFHYAAWSPPRVSSQKIMKFCLWIHTAKDTPAQGEGWIFVSWDSSRLTSVPSTSSSHSFTFWVGLLGHYCRGSPRARRGC